MHQRLGASSRNEVGPREDSALQCSEGLGFASTLILDVWPPELGENRFLLFKPPRLRDFVMVVPGHRECDVRAGVEGSLKMKPAQSPGDRERTAGYE